MKKTNKNHCEPILEKIVSTPNGKYQLKLVKATDTPFNSSFDLNVTHFHPGILESMLGQDVKIYPDACHDYEDVYPEYGKVKFENTAAKEIGYNHTIGMFFVRFCQDAISPNRDNYPTPLKPRTRHFPIPNSASRKLRIYFKSIYNKISGK